jgi:DNA-binding transcriptional LysR family regulator
VFYEHCARIMQEAQLAEQRLTQTQSEPAGVVKVSAVPAFAIRHLLPALKDFQQAYPKIQVKLLCSNRTVDLRDEGFDLAVRVSFGPAPHLVARKLAANRSVLCASPAYVQEYGTPRRIEDLREHRCVLFSPIASRRTWTFRRDGRKYAVQVDGALETDEMDAVRAAVLDGFGISPLPLYMAADSLRQGRLVPMLRKFEILPESGIYLAYLPNRTLPSRVRVLIDFLTERFGPVPSWEVDW